MRGRRLLDAALDRLVAARSRIRRIERRELGEFRRWIQDTSNLLHLSIVLFVPVVIGFVTYVSNQVQTLSFLLFPPLASGTYTLFRDPEGEYANPVRFVASLSVGALCGLVAYTATVWAYGNVAPGVVHPESAALAIFLTGLITWAADVEAPSAFATALLALVTGDVDPATYLVSIVLASSLVAGAFVVWREQFYEQRAKYLYETVRGDDHVLVPMRGTTGERTAFFGARLAAAHEAGKVVLCDVVSEAAAETDSPAEATDGEAADTVTEITSTASDDGTLSPNYGDGTRSPNAGDGTRSVDSGDGTAPTSSDAATLSTATAERVERLERIAGTVRTRVGVPCEVVVVAGDPLPATLQAARNANCDLVVTPYEAHHGALSTFVRGIFGSEFDAVAFRSSTDRRRWSRVLVLVARPGDTAHAMIDFATRLTHGRGMVSVTTCVGSDVERRRAENRLDHLVETVEGNVETRVARSSVDDFIAANAGHYDLLVLGSSGERSPASRFVSPPMFQRLEGLDCDVAVFDRGTP
jgi:hypothetical protein